MIENPPPNTELYHYCPTESFFGIVSSKSIWLSNSQYANDPTENRISYDILADLAKGAQSPEIQRLAAKALQNEFRLIDNLSCYVFCLSEKADDLNQWRIYADNGRGYMIGFRPRYFLDNGIWSLLDSKIGGLEFDKVFLSRCIYDHERQRSIIEKLVRSFAANENPEGDGNIFQLKYQLKFYSSIFKHSSYADENEWRALCFPISQPQDPGAPVKYLLHFRTRRSAIVQYIKLDYAKFSTGDNPPFDKIFLGPNVPNDAQEIANFAAFNGVNWGRFKKSSLKFRDA